MFNLAHNYMNSVIVTEGFYETEIHAYTTASFMERKGLPNLSVADHSYAFSSALLSM
jgi:hypothetical protein